MFLFITSCTINTNLTVYQCTKSYVLYLVWIPIYFNNKNTWILLLIYKLTFSQGGEEVLGQSKIYLRMLSGFKLNILHQKYGFDLNPQTLFTFYKNTKLWLPLYKRRYWPKWLKPI